MADARSLVSIGLPIYNSGRFLAETLDSIAGQTLQDYEILISDNASTDDTEEICRAFADADDRIRYQRHGANVGLVGNFRTVLDMASGRYFKWAAGDDLLDPRYLEACVDVLEKEPAVVVCSSRMPFVDEHLQPVPFDEQRGGFVTPYGEVLQWLDIPAGLESDDEVDRFRAVVHGVRGNLTAEFLYGVIRKQALDRIGALGRYLGAEKVLLGELSLIGSFRRIQEDLLIRRMHPDHHGGFSVVGITKVFDPEWSGRISFPAAKEFRGYAAAIAASSLPSADKLRCYVTLGHKVFARQSLKKLLLSPRSYLGIRSRRGAG